MVEETTIKGINMPPIDLFNSAFNIFLNTGRFKISDSALSLKQLQTIHAHLKKYPILVGRTVAFYEIHLNNVELVPFHIEELIEPKSSEDTLLSGDLAEQELPASLKGRFELNSEDKTLRILNYLERPEYFQKIDHAYAITAIEKTLLNLFGVAKWKIIKLEGIGIAGKAESKPLNFQFIFNLYEILSPYADQIKELSLKKIDFFNKDALVDFLKKASHLDILSLEDIQQEKDFSSPLDAPNVLLNRLCEVLADHSTLRQLDLSDMVFNEEGYFKLFELLKNNDCLEQIILKSPPVLGSLNQLHDNLIRQMEERTKKSGLERFQEKRLTSHNLYQLAELILQLESHPLKLFLNYNNKIVITRLSNEKLPKNLVEILPKGLRKYPDYLQQSWPIELDMSQALDNQTLGAHLLEKAFQLRKPQIMRWLLLAGADLFEGLAGKSNLIARIFSDKEEKIYKQLILNHVKKDLSVFVPFISRLMPTYKKIDVGLRKIKSDLDEFVTALLELDQLPLILKIFKGAGLETKKEIWERDLRLVVQATRAGTHKYPITHSSLSDFEAILHALYFEVEKDTKQWFAGYQFNKKLLGSLKQLLQSTREYQSDLFREWEQQGGGTLAENIQLKEQLKNSQETIEKMQAKHAQNLADQEAKHAQNLADQEAKRIQDKAEMEAERAQDKAEMDAKINQLIDYFASSQQALTSGSRQENNTRFFTKP